MIFFLWSNCCLRVCLISTTLCEFSSFPSVTGFNFILLWLEKIFHIKLIFKKICWDLVCGLTCDLSWVMSLVALRSMCVHLLSLIGLLYYVFFFLTYLHAGASVPLWRVGVFEISICLFLFLPLSLSIFASCILVHYWGGGQMFIIVIASCSIEPFVNL